MKSRAASAAVEAALSLALAAHAPLASAQPAAATGSRSAKELAKELSNPVAALISVPFQLNYDRGIGPAEDGTRWLLNIQPVVPVMLNADWNLILRTIVPVVWQDEVVPGAGSQFGLGDVVQSLFFSPTAPTSGGLIWGAGPVVLLPTGTDSLLSGRKWGAGPTGVVLKQEGSWTYGALANHLWSVAGSDARPNINATYLQPFVSYTTPEALTFAFNTESTYDWQNRQWTVPLNATVSKVTRIGEQMISFGGGVRYWAEGSDAAPSGWGARLFVTLLFPR